MIFWSRDGERYRVAADYEVPSSVNARLRRRSDGASILSNPIPSTLNTLTA